MAIRGLNAAEVMLVAGGDDIIVTAPWRMNSDGGGGASGSGAYGNGQSGGGGSGSNEGAGGGGGNSTASSPANTALSNAAAGAQCLGGVAATILTDGLASFAVGVATVGACYQAGKQIVGTLK